MPHAAAERTAMARALELAALGPAHGPNPRVGAVILDRNGQVIGEGFHQGAGTAHAEVRALDAARAAGTPTQGATAVVTLEPCHHTGRTGPCTAALIEAGIARVVHAVADPTAAGGGAGALRRSGVDVVGGLLADQAAALIDVWLTAVRSGRPFVTLKLASTLDGRVAAPDGTSTWITSVESRAHAHRLRAEVDAIAVGTATVLADRPSLTARTPGGLADHQPLRVILGDRPVTSPGLEGPGGEVVRIPGHDPLAALAELARREVRHLLVEGGPTVAGAFLRTGVVDQVMAYLAPVVLGAGRSAVADLGITTLADAVRLHTVEVHRLGPDVVVVARTKES